MFKRTKLLATASALIFITGTAFSQDADANTVVATVDGTDITVGHMIVLRQSLPEQYQALEDEVLFTGILDQLIQQTVLSQSVSDNGESVKLRLENERRALLAGVAIEELIANATTDEALQDAYDARFAGIEPSREFNASHILIDTEEEALALTTELADGAEFSELAKSKSIGPSGPNGGELGWFSAGMMVPEFEEAVMGMEIGQVSAPVQTQFGWHVIKLNDSRIKDAPPIEEVRDTLAQEIQQSVIETTLTELTDAADVQRPDVSAIPTSIIRDLSLISD